MAIPTTMKLTPSATITVADGVSQDSSGEFWQRVTGNVFVVYENVPTALALEIQTQPDVDTAIKLQLASYPKRVASATS